MKREEFEKKLKAYAAAAAGVVAAAPAGVMLGASPAEAQVQCINQTIVVNPTNTSTGIDLNNDGVVDFTIFYNVWMTSESWGLYINPTTSGGIGGGSFVATSTDADPVRLPAGYSIRSNLPTYDWGNTSNGILAFYSTTPLGYNVYGSFAGGRGYIGVRFTSSTCNSGNYLYGFIDFEGDNLAQVGTIRGWAYEDNCNQPIQAGATCEVTSVPTLNQWGLLALIGLLAGGGAIAIRRREAEG